MVMRMVSHEIGHAHHFLPVFLASGSHHDIMYILLVHPHDAVEMIKVGSGELPCAVCEVIAMPCSMPTHTCVGQVAHMPPTDTGGVDVKPMPRPILLHDVSHDALCRRRPADVSETDEEDTVFLMVIHIYKCMVMIKTRKGARWTPFAVRTRLERVTSCVTGRHSNLLN